MDDYTSDFDIEVDEPHTLIAPLPASSNWFGRLCACGPGLCSTFGWRLLAFMVVSQLLLKGIAYSTISAMSLPLFRGVLGLDAAQMQLYGLIVLAPWSVKPLFGLLSDLVSIRGMHRRPWLFATLAVGCASAACLFWARQVLVAVCLCGVSLQIALFDLLTEGAYSTAIRKHPETGSGGVTFAQALQRVGGLAAVAYVGAMADANLFHVLFALLCVYCALSIVPTLAGWLPEPSVTLQRPVCCFFDYVRWHRERPIVIVIALTGLAAPCVAVLANVGDPALGLAAALVALVGALVGAFWAFPSVVARVALYQVLTVLARPSMRGALDYFYTADASCLVDGPHFSYTYYVTVAGLIGMGASIFATLIYQLLLGRLRYRTVLVLTTILTSLTGASDLILVTRTNIALGIPDEWAYLVGEAIAEPMLFTLAYIPAVALLSKVCPPGLESSVFAFLAGIYNFAAMTSSLSGALIFEAAGVKTVGVCNFGALWWLVVAFHVSLPAVVGVPAAWLIPNRLQTEELEAEH